MAANKKAVSKTKTAAKVKIKTIKQIVSFPASPAEAYELIMDEKKHSRFTGGKAKVSREVGGTFSAFDGYCGGTHLELVEGKKIRQTWRGRGWPAGHFSTANFAFAKAPGGCKLTFTQTGVPEKEFKAISSGWHEYYWEPMREMLERG